MSRMKRWLAAGFAAGAMACAAHGVTFTWTGGGANDNWDNCSNWNPTTLNPPNCYPGGGSPGADDAIVPYTSGGYDVKLLSKTIDDLTIAGSVDFTAQSGTPSLSTDSVTISGGTYGATATISGATVLTRND